MEEYNPPFAITNKILELTAKIMEKIGRLDNYDNFERMPILRRNNKINSIYSSLKIEANSLSFEQVKDVINGKEVVGLEKEIKEVENAVKAYNLIKKLNPFSLEDLKMVHKVMMDSILDNAGSFRLCSEGVFNNGKCIFIAPPHDLVPFQMSQLMSYLDREKNNIHPLILSSVFHYEFVFIHPFKDGNGRIARLWQNVMLTNFKEVFEYIPIETEIRKHQDEYYRAIAESHSNGDSTVFIEFILDIINEALENVVKTTTEAFTVDNININKLLNVLEFGRPVSAFEIMGRLNIKSKENFRANYLNPALELGLVKLTIPNKPTSKNQKYYKN